MKCIACNTENGSDAKFCRNCGAALAAPRQPEVVPIGVAPEASSAIALMISAPVETTSAILLNASISDSFEKISKSFRSSGCKPRTRRIMPTALSCVAASSAWLGACTLMLMERNCRP